MNFQSSDNYLTMSKKVGFDPRLESGTRISKKAVSKFLERAAEDLEEIAEKSEPQVCADPDDKYADPSFKIARLLESDLFLFLQLYYGAPKRASENKELLRDDDAISSEEMYAELGKFIIEKARKNLGEFYERKK